MKLLAALGVLSMAFSVAEAETKLTIEEQIGQTLISYMDAEEIDDTTHEFLSKQRLGGVIFYNWSNKLDSYEQVKALALGLQEQAEKLNMPPLFISADQEGGLVARLRVGFTEFPGNAALGRTDSEELAFTSAKLMGQEMMEVGVNFTFAPVVDVNSNRDNPVIGIRSYGESPELVTRLGLAATHGFAASGVISCLKHFPGHGDVDVDSHCSLPVLHKPKRELDALELAPFKAILNESPAIMTAHLRIPELDCNCCATLSKTILTDLLRNELGYQGLIVTDSLSMGAVLEECCDIGEVAVRAFEAGSDLLVIGGKTLNDEDEMSHNQELLFIQQALLHAVDEGRISLERLEESVERILKTKRRFSLGELPVVQSEKQAAFDCSYKIAEKAIRLERGAYSSTLWNQRIAIVAPKLLKEAIEASELESLGCSSKSFYFDGLDGTLEETVEDVDSVIFLSYNAWRFTSQASLLKELSERFPLMLVAVRDARDAELKNSAESIVTTVSPTAVAFRVLLDRLTLAAVEREVAFEEADSIGKKIWFNECAQRVDQLIYWKDGEQWPSVGIGHFIWPPESYTGTFRAGRFHHVLAFLKEHHASLPSWLADTRYSPWQSGDEFRAEEQSAQMQELRDFLVATVPLQAKYMVGRFWGSLPNLVSGLSSKERVSLIMQVQRLLETPGGLFALVDYLNFKHEGTALKEEYNGVRWGLKQVLLGMGNTNSPLEDLVVSAKSRLQQRVDASPEERNEARWIPGWFNRLDRYLLYCKSSSSK